MAEPCVYIPVRDEASTGRQRVREPPVCAMPLRLNFGLLFSDPPEGGLDLVLFADDCVLLFQ